MTITWDFLFKFHKMFKDVSAEIIEYLVFHGGQFEGSYREFAIALGKNEDQYSNIHGYVKELCKIGILRTTVDRYTVVELKPDWMEVIMNDGN